MDSDLGDLGDINDILEQISNIKMEAEPDVDAVKEDEPMSQDDDDEVEEIVESKPDVAEVEVIMPKTESNWSTEMFTSIVIGWIMRKRVFREPKHM